MTASFIIIRSWGNVPMEFLADSFRRLKLHFALMVAALSNLILMLNKKHGAYNRHKTRTAILCFLFVRDNGPINVFMPIFAYNEQTTVVLFAHGVAVSVHCNKQQSQVLFHPGWGSFDSL